MEQMRKTGSVNVFDSTLLFDWYDGHGRFLPWRRRAPERADPYYVFLSELMLQQTVVATVIPYFNNFISRWPDIFALAAAQDEDVLSAWAGLGYYARARNMLKTARLIVSDFGGQFPAEQGALESLPGIGPYTAGAIAAIAFGRPAVVLDGNIERILIRYCALEQPAKKIKRELADVYSACLPDSRLSDFPQALMDLGALVCQPRRTDCAVCPLSRHCRSASRDNPAALPVRAAKQAKPTRRGTVLIITNAKGQMLVGRRPNSGLLGGMLAFPSYGWDNSIRPDWADDADADFGWQLVRAQLRHVFTHFTADIDIYTGHVLTDWPLPQGWYWADCRPDALPSLMAKCWKLARGAS